MVRKNEKQFKELAPIINKALGLHAFENMEDDFEVIVQKHGLRVTKHDMDMLFLGFIWGHTNTVDPTARFNTNYGGQDVGGNGELQ